MGVEKDYEPEPSAMEGMRRLGVGQSVFFFFFFFSFLRRTGGKGKRGALLCQAMPGCRQGKTGHVNSYHRCFGSGGAAVMGLRPTCSGI